MDEGQGFDWKKPFIPETEDERGRGLLLVAGVTDTFEIKGNQVIVTKRI
jgi:anti-sigma regulatory factor (Ser/Thr protein kinase)